MPPTMQKSCLLNECKGAIVKNTLTPAKQAADQRPAAADQRGTTAPRFTVSDRQTGETGGCKRTSAGLMAGRGGAEAK